MSRSQVVHPAVLLPPAQPGSKSPSDSPLPRLLPGFRALPIFLTTLVALHFTPVDQSDDGLFVVADKQASRFASFFIPIRPGLPTCQSSSCVHKRKLSCPFTAALPQVHNHTSPSFLDVYCVSISRTYPSLCNLPKPPYNLRRELPEPCHFC